MNVGNLDIETTAQCVVLRMRHVVDGHPSVVLARDEVPKLISKLQAALKAVPPPADDDDLIG